MICRVLGFIVLLSIVVVAFADDEYTGRILPENAENVNYSLECGCLVPVSNLAVQAEVNNFKLVLDDILRPANDYARTFYDVKYFNGPWNFGHDFGPNGVTCVRGINHRGFIVRNATYETYAESDAIQAEWNANPVDWRPPNTIIEYSSTEPRPNYDNIPR